MDVVVLDENEVPFQLAVLAQMNDPLDVPLPFVVTRMGLSGKNELHGPLSIGYQLSDAVKILKDKRRPLVGGEPGGEAAGQGVQVSHVVDSDEVGGCDS